MISYMVKDSDWGNNFIPRILTNGRKKRGDRTKQCGDQSEGLEPRGAGQPLEKVKNGLSPSMSRRDSASLPSQRSF